MEEQKRKGTDQKSAPNQKAHSNLNKIKNTCLTLFIISILLILIGQHRENDRMLSVGWGIGFASALVQITINLEGDDEE